MSAAPVSEPNASSPGGWAPNPMAVELPGASSGEPQPRAWAPNPMAVEVPVDEYGEAVQLPLGAAVDPAVLDLDAIERELDEIDQALRTVATAS